MDTPFFSIISHALCERKIASHLEARTLRINAFKTSYNI